MLQYTAHGFGRGRSLFKITFSIHRGVEERMMKKQHYMTRDERYQLEAYLKAGKPVSWIAREMGFCERTIYYEKKRGAYEHECMWNTEIRYSADKG